MYNPEDLKQAVDVLKKGGVILYPTDTVWGLGCDASNADAISRIYDIKKRADSKSMLVLVDSEGMLERSVQCVPDVAWQLIEAAVNPITIIYDQPVGVAPNLVAPDGSLGVRITSEPFSAALCRRLRRPLVSTSANISGKPTPRTFSEISKEIRDSVDYVVEYGRDLPAGKPSNIIKLSNSGIVKVIR